MNRAELIQFLSTASSYPHCPEKVTHIQTHASDVFIAPPYVYKVKKPVDFGFLDFSTLKKRKFYLEQELVLNRRLTNDIYLEVTEISLVSGQYTFGPGEITVEYALIMRELPEQYFLKSLLDKELAKKPDFERIAKKLVNFYNTQKQDSGIDLFGKPERIKPDILDNIESSRKYAGQTISPSAINILEYYNNSFFTDKAHLLEDRIKKGFIKDCHGDLHIEHINISPEALNIYDCIEFNERFRYIDTASDTAFLAMDLDYNGYQQYSRYFISQISELMPDENIYSVIDFYKCYRAAVRGKVLSMKADEKEVPQASRESCTQNACCYFSLALRYAVLGSTPSIIVTFGSIGSGKTTLSRALSDELNSISFSSDITRKQTLGEDPYEKHYENYGEGIYSSEITENVYTELIQKALQEAQANGCVVIDASFSKQKWRENLRNAASEKNISVYFIQTRASEETIKKRLFEREIKNLSVSDGRLEILGQFLAEFEDPDDNEYEDTFTIDTTSSIDITIEEALKNLLRMKEESYP